MISMTRLERFTVLMLDSSPSGGQERVLAAIQRDGVVHILTTKGNKIDLEWLGSDIHEISDYGFTLVLADGTECSSDWLINDAERV